MFRWRNIYSQNMWHNSDLTSNHRTIEHSHNSDLTSNRLDLVAQLAKHWTSKPKVARVRSTPWLSWFFSLPGVNILDFLPSPSPFYPHPRLFTLTLAFLPSPFYPHLFTLTLAFLPSPSTFYPHPRLFTLTFLPSPSTFYPRHSTIRQTHKHSCNNAEQYSWQLWTMFKPVPNNIVQCCAFFAV